jgi:hypothetical protein
MYRARARCSKVASGGKTAADQHDTFDADAPNTRCNREWRRCADDDYGDTRLRWKKMASDARKKQLREDRTFDDQNGGLGWGGGGSRESERKGKIMQLVM